MPRKHKSKLKGKLVRRLGHFFTNPFTYIGIVIVISIVTATYVVYVFEANGKTDSGIIDNFTLPQKF